MITEVELKVVLKVDADATQSINKIKLAARQAVTNALQAAYENGFEHDLADVSIRVADVEVVATSIECQRCSSDLNTRGKCTDATCPFSDHKQNCPAGWQGHPEHKSGPCNCKRKR